MLTEPLEDVGHHATVNPVVGGRGKTAAYDALGMKPPKAGLVYCCSTIGWVTPAEAAAHNYDSSFGWDD